MTETLTLPNGETVAEDDLVLFNGYPYRVVFTDDEFAFVLSPLYWGDSGMDVPFPDRDALGEQWGPDSRGTLTPAEWGQWLRDARDDDRFGDEELDELARELPTSAGGDGLLARVRRALRR